MSEWLVLLNSLLSALFATLIAGGVGSWLAFKWNERQKKRELELALVGKFYDSYGEFCAVWREWNYYIDHRREELISRKPLLFERACKAEATLEAVLLKLSCERTLTADDLAKLGNLRQAFQVLRERMREDQRIDYNRSGQSDYAEFKRLATFLGTLVMGSLPSKAPDSKLASRSFEEITDNKYEERWRLKPR